MELPAMSSEGDIQDHLRPHTLPFGPPAMSRRTPLGRAAALWTSLGPWGTETLEAAHRALDASTPPATRASTAAEGASAQPATRASARGDERWKGAPKSPLREGSGATLSLMAGAAQRHHR